MDEKREAVELLRGWSMWLVAAGMGVGIPSTLSPKVSWWLFPLAFAFVFWVAHKMGKAIKRVEGLLNINAP